MSCYSTTRWLLGPGVCGATAMVKKKTIIGCVHVPRHHVVGRDCSPLSLTIAHALAPKSRTSVLFPEALFGCRGILSLCFLVTSTEKKTRMKYPQIHQWIQCTNGRVSVSPQRLEELCDAMPILRNLLMGHPEMAEKPAVYDQDDGAQVLQIPNDLGVTRRVMTWLIRAVAKGVLPSRWKHKGRTQRDRHCSRRMRRLGRKISRNQGLQSFDTRRGFPSLV